MELVLCRELLYECARVAREDTQLPDGARVRGAPAAAAPLHAAATPASLALRSMIDVDGADGKRA